MSHSHYRGKLYTNTEIKGPFTEAKDDFGVAFDLLKKNVDNFVGIWVHHGHIYIDFGELLIEIKRTGHLEVSEGAA